jgi:hypothetical protein
VSGVYSLLPQNEILSATVTVAFLAKSTEIDMAFCGIIAYVDKHGFIAIATLTLIYVVDCLCLNLPLCSCAHSALLIRPPLLHSFNYLIKIAIKEVHIVYV